MLEEEFPKRRFAKQSNRTVREQFERDLHTSSHSIDLSMASIGILNPGSDQIEKRRLFVQHQSNLKYNQGE